MSVAVTQRPPIPACFIVSCCVSYGYINPRDFAAATIALGPAFDVEPLSTASQLDEADVGDTRRGDFVPKFIPTDSRVPFGELGQILQGHVDVSSCDWTVRVQFTRPFANLA